MSQSAIPTETSKPKKKERDYSIAVSKWLLYILFGIVLLVFIALTSYGTSIGIEIAAKFLPTLVGLFITLIFFWIFFPYREESEWKPVEKAVFSRIQRINALLFGNILFYVKTGSEIQEKLWSIPFPDTKKRNALAFDELCKLKESDVELDENMIMIFLEDKEIYLNFFRSQSLSLGEIEGRYSRFLKPNLRLAMIKTQEAIDNLQVLVDWRFTEKKFQNSKFSKLFPAPTIKQKPILLTISYNFKQVIEQSFW